MAIFDGNVLFNLNIVGAALLALFVAFLLSSTVNFPKIRGIRPGMKWAVVGITALALVFGTSAGLSLVGGASLGGAPASVVNPAPGSFYQPVLQLSSVDALNTSTAAQYVGPTVLLVDQANTAGGIVDSVTVVASSAGGSSSKITAGHSYTAIAQKTTTRYQDPETIATGAGTTSFQFKQYNFTQPTLAVYNVINTEFVNSTYSTFAFANLTAETTNSALTAGSTPDTLQFRFQIGTAFTVFGDPRESNPLAVCTTAKPSTFTISTSAPSIAVFPLAIANGQFSCWQASGSSQPYLGTADSGTSFFQFQIYLQGGQSFAATTWQLYDKTSFVDKTGYGVGHGFNDDSSVINGVGATDPVVRLTQGTSL